MRNLVPSIGASVLGILFENLLSTRKIMRLPVSNQISKKVAQPDAVINLAPANASILGILSNHVISTSAQLSSLGFKQEKKGSSTRAKRVISTGGKRATFLGVRKGYPTEARNTGPAPLRQQARPPGLQRAFSWQDSLEALRYSCDSSVCPAREVRAY